MAGTQTVAWLTLAWLAARLFGLFRRWLVAPVLLWGYRVLYIGGVLGGAFFGPFLGVTLSLLALVHTKAAIAASIMKIFGNKGILITIGILGLLLFLIYRFQNKLLYMPGTACPI